MWWCWKQKHPKDDRKNSQKYGTRWTATTIRYAPHIWFLGPSLIHKGFSIHVIHISSIFRRMKISGIPTEKRREERKGEGGRGAPMPWEMAAIPGYWETKWCMWRQRKGREKVKVEATRQSKMQARGRGQFRFYNFLKNKTKKKKLKEAIPLLDEWWTLNPCLLKGVGC